MLRTTVGASSFSPKKNKWIVTNLLMKKTLSSRGSSRIVSRYISSSTRRNRPPSWSTLHAIHSTTTHKESRHGSQVITVTLDHHHVLLTFLEAEREILYDLGVQPAVISLVRLLSTTRSNGILRHHQTEGPAGLQSNQICPRQTSNM